MVVNTEGRNIPQAAEVVDLFRISFYKYLWTSVSSVPDVEFGISCGWGVVVKEMSSLPPWSRQSINQHRNTLAMTNYGACSAESKVL